MKIDTLYIQHDVTATDDPKIMKLIRVHNVAGYGLYWMINEILRKQPSLNLNVDSIPDLADKFKVSKEILTSIVNDFGLYTIEENVFFTERMIRDVHEQDKKKRFLSESGKKGMEKRWKPNQKLLPPNNDLITTLSENDNTLIGSDNKERRGEKRREEDIYKSEIFDLKIDLKKFDITENDSEIRYKLVIDALNSETWLMEVRRSTHLTKDKIMRDLEAFKNDIKPKMEHLNPIFDIKSHFVNKLKMNK